MSGETAGCIVGSLLTPAPAGYMSIMDMADTASLPPEIASLCLDSLRHRGLVIQISEGHNKKKG